MISLSDMRSGSVSEEEITAARRTLRDNVASKFAHHKLALLVIFTMIIALVLVVISMVMYNVSGTAQLDLSRPGFEGVSTHVDEDLRDFRTYSATGPIDSSSLEEFSELFDAQMDNVHSYDAFGGDPLNPEALGVSEPEDE